MPADPIYRSPEALDAFETNPRVIRLRAAQRRRATELSPEEIHAGCARRMAYYDALPPDLRYVVREHGERALKNYQETGLIF